MQRERDELVDGPYRRDFLTYDNHILDGDIFLQVSHILKPIKVQKISFKNY